MNITHQTADDIAKRFALALERRIGALKGDDGKFPSDDTTIGQTTHQVLFDPTTGPEIHRMASGDIDDLANRLADDFAGRLLALPRGKFRKMEMPAGVPYGVQVHLRGMHVRLLPMYDAFNDETTIGLFISYS